MNESIIEIDQLYLLRNNSFLKQEANLSNTEYKILSLTMAKVQKELLEEYPTWDKKTVERMPPAIECHLHLEELKQLDIRENDLYGKNLSAMLNKLNKTQVNFVSYITGGYVFSHLISEFEVNKVTGNIRALMSKQVFMFLLDYNASFDFRKNFPDYKEVKESPSPQKRLIAKGYTKVNLETIDKFKSYYTQIMYAHFKTEFEKINSKDRNIVEFEVTYPVIFLRKILGVIFIDEQGNEKMKYTRYQDFKKNVIERAIFELKKQNYFEVACTENIKRGRGGGTVNSILFKVKYLGKVEDIDGNKYRNSKEKEKTKTIDVEYKEIKDNLSLAETLTSKLKNSSKIKLAVRTIQNFIDTYGEMNTKRAVNSLMLKCEDERVGAPKQYLLTVLEDMYARENGHAVQKNNYKDINPKSFNNFEPRVYDYEKLERQLLGWDKPDETNLEDKSNLGNYTSNNSKRFKAQDSVNRSEEEYGEIEKQLLSWYEN